MSEGGRVLLGRIAGAHGIKGEVVVHAFTENPEDVAGYGPLADKRGTRTFELSVVRVTEKGVIARVVGVADRTQAEALKGSELWITRDRLPQAEEGEFYHADLIGLAAVDPDGAGIGTVVAVQNYGAGDLLEIRLDGRRNTELVAFTKDFVPVVDLDAGRVVINRSEPQAIEDGDGSDPDGA